MSISKKLVAESFSRAANTYDNSAFLQKEVAERLFERLALMNINPCKVLDVGCGTGFCSRQLKSLFSKANIHGIDIAPGMIEKALSQQSLFKKINYQVADADRLPFADNQFDVVFSNLTLQWMPDLQKTFTELNRVLNKNGLLIFSTLGPDTLIELKQSWQGIDEGIHVNNFIDMHIVGDHVFNAHFENTVMDRDMITLTYRTMIGLMKDLKAIGAHNIDSQRSKGLMGKDKFKHLEKNYESYRLQSGELPATYEVIYGHAWKKIEQPSKDYHTHKVELQSPVVKD